MTYRILADATVLLHFAFILFAVIGGLAVLRWPRFAWAHVPVFLWGGGIEIAGGICPLTPLENNWRALAGQAGYATSFVEHYILPAIYPALWFPGGFPRWGFVALGVFVLAFNGAIYLRLWRRLQKPQDE